MTGAEPVGVIPAGSTGAAGSAELTGPVRIVGTGLIGSSIGLALRRAGVDVELVDADAGALELAARIGAGSPAATGSEPRLVLVAVPPRVVGRVLAEQLAATAGHVVVTDVCSVKGLPLSELTTNIGDLGELARYVGTHPMAGSERSGPLAARAGMFDGATWAICPHAGSDPRATALATALAETCGARVVELNADEHDLAVARVSHLPHLMAALVAGRLTDAPAAHLELAGQGIRDVTRVAAADPELWTQIVTGNASALAGLLGELRGQLDILIDALAADDPAGSTGLAPVLAPVLARGVEGTTRIPGKHGQPHTEQAVVTVVLSDEPGQFARMFADAGDAGVNIEDVRVEHSPGRPVGHVELSVRPEVVQRLLTALTERGWVSHAGGAGTE